MEALERFTAGLPKGWRNVSIAYDSDKKRWEAAARPPNAALGITAVYTCGRTPDEAVDEFLREVKKAGR